MIHNLSNTTASPKKMRSGEWGITFATNQIGSPVSKGDEVEITVRTRAGKTWRGTHTVIWAGNGQAIAVPAKQRQRSSRGSGRSECAECGEFIRSRGQRCWETGGSCYA